MKTCITYHEFLDVVPLSARKKYLVLGTIHPYTPQGTGSFLCKFFYGNKYSLWGILKTAFPSLAIDCPEEIISAEEAAAKICAVLNKYDIAISDTVQIGIRPLNQSSADIFVKGTLYNEALIDQIKEAHALQKIFLPVKGSWSSFFVSTKKF